MNKTKEIQPEAPQEPAPPSHDPANDPVMSSRRELIERYAKYAVVAAPLLGVCIEGARDSQQAVDSDTRWKDDPPCPGRAVFLQEAKRPQDGHEPVADPMAFRPTIVLSSRRKVA